MLSLKHTKNSLVFLSAMRTLNRLSPYLAPLFLPLGFGLATCAQSFSTEQPSSYVSLELKVAESKEDPCDPKVNPYYFRECEPYVRDREEFLGSVYWDFSITVLPGDTLWDIAEEVYGDPFKWKRIYDDNKEYNPLNSIKDPSTDLKSGQRLLVFVQVGQVEKYKKEHPERDLIVWHAP